MDIEVEKRSRRRGERHIEIAPCSPVRPSGEPEKLHMTQSAVFLLHAQSSQQFIGSGETHAVTDLKNQMFIGKRRFERDRVRG